MKNLIYLIPVFLLPGLLAAQYQPVLSAQKTEFYILFEPLDAGLEGTIRVEGDTVVNQISYKKVFFKGDFSLEALVGLVRENADEGKLWFWNNLDNQEALVMDLNLAPGDTFPVANTSDCWDGDSGGPIIQVAEVYSLESKKVISMDCWHGGSFIGGDSLKFIEGAGPNATLFLQNKNLDYEIAGIGYRLCRILREDTLAFPLFSDVDFCGIPTDVQEIPGVGGFSIFPNPAGSSVALFHFMPLSKPVSWRLYDGFGRKVREKTLEAGDSRAEVSLVGLAGGIYYYLFEKEGTAISSGKLLVVE